MNTPEPDRILPSIIADMEPRKPGWHAMQIIDDNGEVIFDGERLTPYGEALTAEVKAQKDTR